MDFNRRVAPDEYPAGDMPPYPARTLTAHVLAKGVQAGALAALLLGEPAAAGACAPRARAACAPNPVRLRPCPAAPIWAYSRGARLTSVLHKAQLLAIPLATGVSGAMLLKKDYDGALSAEGVDDRAYRIVHNAGQVHVDRYSLIGAGVGATAGAIWGPLAATSVLSGAATGVALGVLASVAARKLEAQAAAPPPAKMA